MSFQASCTKPGSSERAVLALSWLENPLAAHLVPSNIPAAPTCMPIHIHPSGIKALPGSFLALKYWACEVRQGGVSCSVPTDEKSS